MTDTLAYQPIAAEADTGTAAVVRLLLQDFRNYSWLDLAVEPHSVVLFGANGAGKTNILEALSLFVPGKGLRGGALQEMDRAIPGGVKPWSVFVEVNGVAGPVQLGTGHDTSVPEADRRTLRIDGEPAKGAHLAEHVSFIWLTPALEQLFLAGAGERRRFVDRMAGQFFPEHSRALYRYEHSVRERNHLLARGGRDESWLGAVEHKIAELAVAIAAARNEMLERLNQAMEEVSTPFPTATLWMEGEVEGWLRIMSALEAEEKARGRLSECRSKDAQLGRTTVGVHKSDLYAVHKAKKRLGTACSTGEQKAIMLSLTLAFVRARKAWNGQPPILLLDEVVAHLDAPRRAALFDEIACLGVQAWMTGTEAAPFAGVEGRSQAFEVRDGALERAW